MTSLFSSAWMLWWAAAAVLPVLIHLWSRRRHQEVPWAATAFLLAALRRHARRLRMEQLLLLSLRVLILVLFGLALANPMLDWLPGGSRPGDRATHWVLVLDGSYSMQHRGAGESRFERARRAARQIVSEAQPGDAFSVVLMSNPPQIVVGEPTFDAQAVLSELDQLQPRDMGARLSATLSAVSALLDRAEQQGDARLAARRVCLFSDLGATTWIEAGDSQCRQLVADLAGRARLLLTDLGGSADQRNLAVTSLRVREPYTTAGSQATLQAVVRSFGVASAAGDELTFLVDGRPVRSLPLDVSAEGTQTVLLTHPFDTAGEHLIEARITPDSLPVDDVRWLSLPVRQRLLALCIAGKHGAARPAALALNPFPGRQLQVEVETAAESALLERDLARYDCLVLCNVGRFGRDEAAALRRYLQGGGGLILFLGDQVQAESYNEMLYDTLPAAQPDGAAGAVRVLPGRLLPAVAPGLQTIDPIDYRHRIVRPFRDHEEAGLRTMPVWKYFPLQITADDQPSASVVARLTNGDPLLAERQVGPGRCVLFASAGSLESMFDQDGSPQVWSAAAQWPSFPPLVQEMFAQCVAQRGAQRNHLVGDPLSGPAGAGEAILILPSGQTRGLGVTSGDAASHRWHFDDTWHAGTYRVRFQAGDGRTRSDDEENRDEDESGRTETAAPPQDEASPADAVRSSDSAASAARPLTYVANLETSESSLARLPAEQLPSQFQLGAVNGDAAALDIDRRRPIYRSLLGLVFALLLVECWAAWRYGSGPP